MLASCAPSPPPLRLHLTNFEAVEGWRGDDFSPALAAFRRSCGAIRAMPPEAKVGNGILAEPASTWQELCETAEGWKEPAAREFFENHFTPFVPEGGAEAGLFTGYYEPLLSGARVKSRRFAWPVYGLPPDVKEGVPYFTRAEIDAGALRGQGLELLWVDDATALFFAQIQGSARVRLPGGARVRIGYAGKNNRPYVAIGKVLKEAGELEDINLFTLRQWLADHPERAQGVMQSNPSYVFFREMPGAGNPLGAQKVELTPERSLAVDAGYIPYGMPLFLQTSLPDGEPFARLMIAQDTGGAIRGPVRGDVFFGSGARAESLAGRMKSRGTYVVLLPHAIAARL